MGGGEAHDGFARSNHVARADVLILIGLATVGAGSEVGVCWMIAFDVAIITALEAGYLGGSAVVALVE
jgi:hypothetical protein